MKYVLLLIVSIISFVNVTSVLAQGCCKLIVTRAGKKEIFKALENIESRTSCEAAKDKAVKEYKQRKNQTLNLDFKFEDGNICSF